MALTFDRYTLHAGFPLDPGVLPPSALEPMTSGGAIEALRRTYTGFGVSDLAFELFPRDCGLMALQVSYFAPEFGERCLDVWYLEPARRKLRVPAFVGA